MEKAVVLLSGGMDSAVTLYMARKSYRCHALLFNYGQKASKELESARLLAENANCSLEELSIRMPWKGSSLTDETKEVPEVSKTSSESIPDTYVPARNIIFLSYAVSFAEAIGASSVFIGAHELDYSNYPDCRSEFFESYREVIRSGTKGGTENRAVEIVTPVLNMTKKEIVQEGTRLDVPFENTWSCYTGEVAPCGVCESCSFRIQAFKDAGIKDPLAALTV